MDVTDPKHDCYDAYQFIIRYFNSYYEGILLVAVAALKWEGKPELADKVQKIIENEIAPKV